MRIVLFPKFFEKWHICDIELFTFGNRLVQVLWLPEFTLPLKGNHIVVENATLVR